MEVCDAHLKIIDFSTKIAANRESRRNFAKNGCLRNWLFRPKIIAEFPVVLLKSGAAEYRELDGLKGEKIVLDNLGRGGRHDLRVVHECPAAERAQHDVFYFVQNGNIQDAAEPLDVQLLEYIVRNADITIAQVRRRTRDDIHVVPVRFAQQFGGRDIGLEHGHSRRIDAVVGMQRSSVAAMRLVEEIPHLLVGKAAVQGGTPAKAFFLCTRPRRDATARVRCRGEVEYRDSGARIRLRRLKRAFLRNDDLGPLRMDIPAVDGDALAFAREFLRPP